MAVTDRISLDRRADVCRFESYQTDNIYYWAIVVIGGVPWKEAVTLLALNIQTAAAEVQFLAPSPIY